MDMMGARADEAFERLEALVAELPAMEAAAQKLARVREAEAIARAAEQAEAQAALLHAAEANEAEARAELSRAERAGAPAVELDTLRRRVAYAGSLKGYRVGAARSAERAAASLVAAGPFPSAEAARAARLPRESVAQMEQHIASYQQAYEAALAECRALVGEEA